MVAHLFVTLPCNTFLMENRVIKYLSQPAPVNNRPWLSVLLCTVSVIFILAIFEPFSFKLNSLGQMRVLLGFALTTILVSSVAFVLLPWIFKRFYDPDKWTIGRSLLSNVFFLCIMGVGIVCYDYFILTKQSPQYFPMGGLWIDLFATFTIGVIALSSLTSTIFPIQKGMHRCIPILFTRFI